MANHDKMRIWESWLHSEAFLLPTVRVCRRWPVRESRPVVEKLQGKEALLTCERVPWTEHLLRAKTLWAGLVKSCDPFDVLADLYINRNGAAMVDSIFFSAWLPRSLMHFSQWPWVELQLCLEPSAVVKQWSPRRGPGLLFSCLWCLRARWWDFSFKESDSVSFSAFWLMYSRLSLYVSFQDLCLACEKTHG